MWTYKKAPLHQSIFQFSIVEDDSPLSFAEVFTLWKTSLPFRSFYNSLLTDQPFNTFFWEHPPVSTVSANAPYEFVLIDGYYLSEAPPDAKAFQEHFKDLQAVVSFKNLGGDALLVVPCPVSDLNNYPHLAAFVRNAPSRQIDMFWQLVGESCVHSLGEKPFYLNTAGLGVYWLHVRLDTFPKYYKHIPYKKSV